MEDSLESSPFVHNDLFIAWRKICCIELEEADHDEW